MFRETPPCRGYEAAEGPLRGFMEASSRCSCTSCDVNPPPNSRLRHMAGAPSQFLRRGKKVDSGSTTRRASVGPAPGAGLRYSLSTPERVLL